MTDRPGIDVSELHSALNEIAAPDGSDNGVEQSTEQPYLKVFGPDIGVFEYGMTDRPVTIGRAEDADIRLPHPRVSREHAAITYSDGEHTLRDVGSNHGTLVNRARIETHSLRHGDSIQIGLYLLQYRTHAAVPGAAAAAARAKLLLRSEYCLLPSTMRLKYRMLAVAAKELFSTGDTLRIGHGGLLIPTPTAPDVSACLELQLLWPSDVSKRYLGEIVGVILEQSTKWTCVKLHTVPRATHKSTVEAGQPGPWIDVVAT